ncbi:hypothetical protein MJO28_005120 [Puccinia striiformis f. sp. tritici]|uniref:Uncharacterized protein n=1 Tax=Puccinia striiformis f. sp. tritici TaxID=168172 RepID=A0ACC0EKB1_9BASI|nr:hypothetical protein MJO28_005120 [Puccinia striiformis f. sp. tritici]
MRKICRSNQLLRFKLAKEQINNLEDVHCMQRHLNRLTMQQYASLLIDSQLASAKSVGALLPINKACHALSTHRPMSLGCALKLTEDMSARVRRGTDLAISASSPHSTAHR